MEQLLNKCLIEIFDCKGDLIAKYRVDQNMEVEKLIQLVQAMHPAVDKITIYIPSIYKKW